MQSVLILSSLVALAVQAIGEPDVQGQVPIAEDELLGTVTAIDSSQPLGDPSSYKFELFPFKGAKCSTAAGGQSSWPTELLRDGGFQYIQKFELDDVDPAMIQAYDPAAGKIKTYNDAFGLRCTKTENIRKYYLFHDENIGHLGYGLDDENKILYMCFMLGQDVDGMPGSGGECMYF